MAVGWVLGRYLIVFVSEPGAYRAAAMGCSRWLVTALPCTVMGYSSKCILQVRGASRSMQSKLLAPLQSRPLDITTSNEYLSAVSGAAKT